MLLSHHNNALTIVLNYCYYLCTVCTVCIRSSKVSTFVFYQALFLEILAISIDRSVRSTLDTIISKVIIIFFRLYVYTVCMYVCARIYSYVCDWLQIGTLPVGLCDLRSLFELLLGNNM